MHHVYYQVFVPTRKVEGPPQRGVHVFTGWAANCGEAVRTAHEVYETARAAAEAGAEIPLCGRDGWAARGYRPGWELDWAAATVAPWTSTYVWREVDGLDV